MDKPTRRLVFSVLLDIFNYLLLLFRFQPGYSAGPLYRQRGKIARQKVSFFRRILAKNEKRPASAGRFC
jgi:hypothetical protein